jgi:isopenicillin N synthase-like dioxygenase
LFFFFVEKYYFNAFNTKNSDLNLLTIHGKSRFPGLYIWTPQGKKLLVRIREGCLLVQAGKQLEWLTGGKIKAGFHEVVVVPETIEAMKSQSEKQRPLWRISSTLFAHTASDQILKPLPPFIEQNPQCKNYPAILAGQQVQEELEFIRLSQ